MRRLLGWCTGVGDSVVAVVEDAVEVIVVAAFVIVSVAVATVAAVEYCGG